MSDAATGRARSRLLRLLFWLGALGVLGSVAAGAVVYVADSGAPPPLMGHPLDPARDALAAGDVVASLDDFRTFVAIQPRDASARLQLARALMQSGELDEATRVLESSLALHPVPAAVHLRLAMLYERAGRLPEAREQLAAAERGGAAIPAPLRRRLARTADGA